MPMDSGTTFTFEDATTPGVEGDPQPGSRPRGRPKGSTNKAKSVAPRKNALQAELESNIFMLSSMSAQLWTMKDDVCGPVLFQQSREIAESIADICINYPELCAKLIAMTSFGQYMKLFMAVSPVVQAVMSHHIMQQPEQQVNGVTFTEAEGVPNGASFPFPT